MSLSFKTNYFTAAPIINNKLLFLDDSHEDYAVTPDITSLYSEDGDELYDHLFYLDCAEDFINYQESQKVCPLIVEMVLEYFEDYIPFDEDNNNLKILLTFYDIGTDEIIFFSTIEINKNLEVIIKAMDIKDVEDELNSCDGDCESCNNSDNQGNDNLYKPKYRFGFDFD